MTGAPDCDRDEGRLDEILAEYLEAADRGEPLSRDSLVARYPNHAGEIDSFLADEARFLKWSSGSDAQDDPAASHVFAVDSQTPVAPKPPSEKRGAEASFGGYVLLEEIARGGAGVVYKALQVGLNRTVALKRLHTLAHVDGFDPARFQREAEAIARLDHPNITPIYESGECAGERFIAMKFMERGDLSQTRNRAGGDPVAVARLVAQVARGLHHAHQRGVLHRDLKPSNILLDGEGRPHIADFGLAKGIVDDAEITKAGEIVGTPSYLAPELAEGDRGEATTASDIHGLGGILYALLTGEPPYKGTSVLDTLRRVRECEPDPPSRKNQRVNRDLDLICLTCLRKNPSERYASAEAAAADLERWLRREPIAAAPIGPARRLAAWCAREPVLAGLSASLLMVVLTAAIVSPIAAVHYNRLARDERRFRIEANARAEESRRGLGRSYRDAAARLMDHGEPLASLPWLAAALEVDQGRPEAELDRRLLGSVTASNPSLEQIRRHRNEIQEYAFSSNGRRIAVAEEGRLVVHDLDREADFVATETPRDRITSLHFSAKGDRLVAGSRDGTARVWAVDPGLKPLATFERGGPVTATAISLDGTLFAAGGSNGRISVVRVDDGSRLGAERRILASVRELEFHPSTPFIAAAGINNEAIVWSWTQRTEQRPARFLHPGNIRHATFTPSGETLITVGVDRVVKFWNWSAGKESAPSLSFPDKLFAATPSPDGSLIAAATEDGFARVFSFGGERPINSRSIKHDKLIRSVRFSGDGESIVTSGYDGAARVWDARTGDPLTPPLPHAGSVLDATFTADAERVVTVSTDQAVRVWNLVPRDSPRTIGRHSGGVRSIAIDAQGETCATAGDDGRVRLWKPAAARSGPIATFMLGDKVTKVAFAPGSNLVAAACRDGVAHVFDASDPSRPAVQFRHGFPLSDLAFWEPAGSIATAGDDGRIKLWKAGEAAAPVATLDLDDGAIVLAISPNRQILVAGGSQGKLAAWRLPACERIGETIRMPAGISSIAFSPDSRFLVAACSDNIPNARYARVFATRNLQPVANPLRHTDGVLQAEFSPGGERILTASEDGSARLWNVADGKPAGAALAHRFEVTRALFAPSGTLIATADRPGGVRFWSAATGEPVSERIDLDTPTRCLAYGGHGSVVFVGADGNVRVIAEPRASAPDEALIREARLTSAQSVGAEDGLSPLAPEAMDELIAHAGPPAHNPGRDAAGLHEARARELEARGLWRGALWRLDHVAAERDAPAALVRRRGIAAARSGDAGRALACLTDPRITGPSNGEDLLVIAWARAAGGDREGADRDASRISDEPLRSLARIIVDAVFSGREASDRISARDWLELADRASAAGDAPLALALDLLKPEAHSGANLGAVFRARGFVLSRLNRRPEAFAAFKEALRLSPDDRLSLAGRALVRSSGGDSAGAIDDLKAAIALDPNAPELWSKLGETHAAAGDHSAALADFLRWRELGAGPSAAAWEQAACLALKSKDESNYQMLTNDALKLLSSRKDRASLVSMIRLCLLGAGSGDSERGALVGARTLMESQSRRRDPELLFLRGAAELRSGDAEAGETHLREALVIDPSWRCSFLNAAFLTLALEANGKTAEAREEIQKVRTWRDRVVAQAKAENRAFPIADWALWIEFELIDQEVGSLPPPKPVR